MIYLFHIHSVYFLDCLPSSLIRLTNIKFEGLHCIIMKQCNFSMKWWEVFFFFLIFFITDSDRKGRTFSRSISHQGKKILQNGNSKTMFIYKNIELLWFPRSYSKTHLFNQPSLRKKEGTNVLNYEQINKK